MVKVAMPFVEQMKDDTYYVVTTKGPKVKHSVTGRYISHDDEYVTLFTKNGRFQRAKIEEIIRINYYYETPDWATEG